jgi:putative CocE/NonD family hydrolase
VLTQDVTISGELRAELYASTSGTDSDFVLKLIDVFPARKIDPMDGYQMLVRGEPMRAKYRNSWSRPEPMKPNEVTRISFALPDINHTFKKDHRVMLHVQSTWFPLVDRNPQKFLNIYQAKDEDFQKATQRIYHSSKFPTRLKVSVLKP